MDVVELRDFYASRLGLASRRLIAHRLRRRWSSLGGATVMGLGFATPYLESWRAETARSFGFMMARQGVIHWPQEGESATALVDEFDLPLLESTVDFALIIHGLELTDNPEEMLQEVWRVMAPQGRLMLIVPNRRGMWARFELDTLRLWPAVLASTARQAPEGGAVHGSGLEPRPVHAAFRKKHDPELGTRLGAVRVLAVSRLFRRHHRRGREAGLCDPTRQAGAPPGAALAAGAISASRDLAALKGHPLIRLRGLCAGRA